MSVRLRTPTRARSAAPLGLLCLCAALSWSCGGPVLTGDVDDVEPIRWSLGPQVLRYHVTQSLRARVEDEDGAGVGVWRRSEFVTSMEMGAQDPDGRALVTVTFDALRAEIDDAVGGTFLFDGAWVPGAEDRSPRAVAIRQMRRQYLDDAYSYSVSPRGEIEVVRAGQTDLGEPWADWVGPLPSSRMKVGEQWVEARDVERPPVGTLRASTTFTMGERTQLGLTSCDNITFETRYAWPNPDEATSVGVDPETLKDTGRLCFGVNGVPLFQERRAVRRAVSDAGEATVEYTQTRTLIPATGLVPWTLEVPVGPPPSQAVAPLQPMQVAAPGLPEGARVRLGSARGTFWSRIDTIEPARKGAWVAVASGPSVVVVDVSTGDRVAAVRTRCDTVANVVWTPDDRHLIGTCDREDRGVDKAVFVWRVKDGAEVRAIELPVAAARVSVAQLEDQLTGFAVDVEGGLWRFDLLADTAPQPVALSWPAADEEDDDEDDADAGAPEDGGLYPEPNDPLVFSRFVVAPDGYQAAGVADGRLVLVDAGAQRVRRVMTDPEVVVRDLVWIPGRSGALIIAVDNRLEIWSADGDGPLRGATVVLDGQEWEGAERLSLSADGRRLLSWQANQGTTLWRVVGDKLVAEVLAIEAREAAALTGGGRYVVSRSRYADALHAYDLKKKRDTGLSGPHGERITDLAAAPDGAHVATADMDGWIQVWTTLGEKVGRFQVNASAQKYGDVVDTFVAFKGGDELLVGHPLGGGYRRLDGSRAKFFEDGFWGIRQVWIDARGRRAVTLHHGNAGVRVWSLEGHSPRELWGERGEPRGVYSGEAYVCGVHLAHGGSRVALQWSDGKVEVRSIEGGAPTLRVNADPTHCRAVLSGDGERLAYLDASTAAIHVVDRGGETLAVLPGSRSVLYGPLLLDDDGDRLVAGRGRALWFFGLGAQTATQVREAPEGEVARLVGLSESSFLSTTTQGTSSLVWDWPAAKARAPKTE